HKTWIEQAHKLGAQAVFFVGDFPTVLFFKCDEHLAVDNETIETYIHNLYIKVWNTGRIAVIFVALPGELRVYSVYQKPVKDVETWQIEQGWLKRVQLTTQVTELAEQLLDFSRSEIESGHLFQKRKQAFKREERVDQWLLKNLRLLRKQLERNDRNKRKHVHALIGRSIFIRYLEDRQVIVEEYFTDPQISQSDHHRCYTDVLRSKEDTYRLFDKLREDFNGDIFPLSAEEREIIQDDDIALLRNFLLGQRLDEYPDLFFWAYQFDIIPIELISSIYEEFYHEHSEKEEGGTHYTPTPLVDFVLSECLTTERLETGARVLDPACGSGIFLVEAFKRILYYECQCRGIADVTQLPCGELTQLLTDRITGIDLNKSAVQVAAFSLYLAFLDFRKPRDIRQNKELPILVYEPGQPDSGKTLFAADTFYLTPSEQQVIQQRLAAKKQYKGRIDDERMLELPVLPLHNEQFDVIVGNPPWGPDTTIATLWCNVFGYPVGYKELSQCFIWRANTFLKPGGEIGLLVSTGIFFKHQDISKTFRQQWLQKNRIRAIYNFAHVRNVFFRNQKKDAIAPFASIFFSSVAQENERDSLQNRISYIAIKQNAFIEQLQAVIIDKADLKKARQRDFIANDWLWKTYMWGGLKDVELIGELKSCYQSLSTFITECSRGFQENGIPKDKSSSLLGVNFELETKLFYRNAEFSKLITPIKPRLLHRLGNENIYKDSRLLIKRGISRSGKKYGEIRARLAYEPFAFKNSIIGLCLADINEDKHKILLAILLSSLAKYYYFLTSSTWGFWHDEIHKEEYLSLPIHFPQSDELKSRILTALDHITTKSDTPTLFDSKSPGWVAMQKQLDEAIFELYELSEAQKDLIRDLCQVTLEFFYRGSDSRAAKPPTIKQLEAYRDVFLEIWNERLVLKGKELEVQIFSPRHGLLCGMSFELKDLGTAIVHKPITDNAQWQHWFRRLSQTLRQEYNERIYIDRVLKELSDSSMFIIKRAEHRFWMKSQARQDAQEFLTEVFKLEWQLRKGAGNELGSTESMGR
ncbi:MAG: N-6 DNA methylase, partial [Deltaproteobacteria bacterium]|nr:N-6 DNA methylase [Deltaproteobacteria bacterium]